MQINKKFSAILASTTILGVIIVIIFTIITAVISWSLYLHTESVLTENLRERLLSVVRTGAVEFDAADLKKLNIEKDWQKPEWTNVVTQLKKIRLNNENILFAYIVRKNAEDPSKIEFVSDSHSIDPYAKIDLNSDGQIDDADLLQWPGQPYDEPPSEIFDAYDVATTSKELIHDQWGVEIVGYAPIKDEKENTIAVIAIDMKADDFERITQENFIPFLAFIISLVGILIMMASGLIYIWNKKVELVAELDRQKDELLGIVSHQLAAPASAMKWYTEMMLDGDLGKMTDELTEHVKSMKSVAADLTDLVSMILDVSRIQLGRMKIEKQDMDLGEFFKDILGVIQPKAEQKKVKFNVQVPEQLPHAQLDKRYTRMTIENLLTNAIKYTPENGDVNFTVELKGNILSCSVKDTGCGIPKAEQDKIFGKLFRASNVRNTVDGNGFGLYVAKGAVEAQGGKIWFESEENKGTKFFIELPVNEKVT